MLLRQNQAKLVFFIIFCCFCCSFLTIFYILSTHDNLKCECSSSTTSSSHKQDQNELIETSEHKLCILVPFRDRFEELMEFAPYISNFLNNQNVKHDIFVINQVDKFRY